MDWLLHGEQQRTAAELPPFRPPDIPAVLGNGSSTAPHGSLEDALAAQIAERTATFTLRDALELPPVVRAVNLIASVAGAFAPTLYRDGIPVPTSEQPRIVRKPAAFMSRPEFVTQTVLALATVGEAFWLLGEYDDDGRPHFATVLPNADISIEWDERRIIPQYSWRGEPIDAYSTRPRLKHIPIGRYAGDLHGRGPVNEALRYLAHIAAAETYAAGWFLTGGIPSVILGTEKELNDQKSAELKRKWIEAHSITASPVPAVLSGGIKAEFPAVNPQDSQLQQARDAAATTVARLLGIPPALLIVQTTGATIVYQNAAGAMTELVRVTIAPTYLTPIEQAWSDLVGSRSAVRFDYAELQRADIQSRYAVYSQAIPLGILDAADARRFEGYADAGPIESSVYRPTPQPIELPSSIEVPMR